MDRELRIYFENEQDKIHVGYETKLLCRQAIVATLDYESFAAKCEVSLTFTDNEKIKELNSRYRNIDRETDVLSFPMLEGEDIDNAPIVMLGDIVVSLEKAKEQGEKFGHGFRRELAFLCIHSTLHLLGYDHETSEADELDMRRRQSAIAENLGLGISNATEKDD